MVSEKDREGHTDTFTQTDRHRDTDRDRENVWRATENLVSGRPCAGKVSPLLRRN